MTFKSHDFGEGLSQKELNINARGELKLIADGRGEMQMISSPNQSAGSPSNQSVASPPSQNVNSSHNNLSQLWESIKKGLS